MSDLEGVPPLVTASVGLFMGALTIETAWPLTFRLCDWHHGFFMIAVSFALFGYGVGKWAWRPDLRDTGKQEKG